MVSLRKLLPRFSLRTLVILPLLVTSAVALWLHWEPWVVKHELTATFEGRRYIHGLWFTPDSSRLVMYCEGEIVLPDMAGIAEVTEFLAWETETGRETKIDVAEFPAPEYRGGTDFKELPDGRQILLVAVENFATWVEVRDRLDRPLTRMWESSSLIISIAVSSDGNMVAATPGAGMAVLYERRRPEWWWGVAYLPELWLTILFSALLTWSILRDRKTLRRGAS